MNVLACRVCDSSVLSFRYQVNGYRILECPHCTSLTTDYDMEKSCAQQYYAASYFHGRDYVDYEASEPISKRNFHRFAQSLSCIQPSGRLLEMNCAYGYFLDVAKKYWDVVSVDVSPDVTARCAE